MAEEIIEGAVEKIEFPHFTGGVRIKHFKRKWMTYLGATKDEQQNHPIHLNLKFGKDGDKTALIFTKQ